MSLTRTSSRAALQHLRLSHARFSVASLAGVLTLSLAPSAAKAQDEHLARRSAQRDELPADGQRRPSPLLMFDTDRDGVVSAAEIAAAPEVLRRLDRDGDGKLSGEELRPRPPRPPGDREDGEGTGTPPPPGSGSTRR
jgi:hypothetical protein